MNLDNGANLCTRATTRWKKIYKYRWLKFLIYYHFNKNGSSLHNETVLRSFLTQGTRRTATSHMQRFGRLRHLLLAKRLAYRKIKRYCRWADNAVPCRVSQIVEQCPTSGPVSVSLTPIPQHAR